MTRTISGINLKVSFVDDEETPRFTVDGTDPTDDRPNKNPTNADLKVTLLPAHVNDAGSIVNLVAAEGGSVSLIKSVARSVRSNHYHLTDWHFLYVVSGLMYYYWRPLEKTPPLEASPTVKRIRCKPGDMVWTPPMVEHATYFPEETTLVTINGRPRDHSSHEEDVVRVAPMISINELCPAVLNGVKCVLPFENTLKGAGNHFHNSPHEDEHGNTFDF